jgi:A/G-specific adenine glycosylase
MLWRQAGVDGRFDPYAIMVSEIMLQQTQVDRVASKYQEFLRQFPTIQDLAAASLAHVLALWSGLGYNRRAKFLWQAAQMVVADFDGVMPTTVHELQKLPGVGKNTAGAIVAYAYDQPVVFVETNIRTVYIHHFFDDQPEVADRVIEELVAATLPARHVREWYWALMDYGSYLKKQVGNKSRQSKHYTKQSAFEGSKRQLRGAVMKLLIVGNQSLQDVQQALNDDRVIEILETLVVEGMVQYDDGLYHL